MSRTKRRAKVPSREKILKEISEEPGRKVKIAATDVDGILRGKVIHADKFLSAARDGVGVCNVVFGWDSADLCYDNATYTGWHTGYPDALAVIDFSTYRRVPWDNRIPFFLADFQDGRGGPLGVCPRALLKKVRDEALRTGFFAAFSQEFEWFNFSETAQALEDRGFRNPRPMSEGMFGYSVLRASQKGAFFNDLFDSLLGFGVPLEGLHTETGPGVYEAAILYDDVLEAADRAVLFKTAVKEIGFRHGIMPSFMAKWNAALPGCSGHLHQSLWDADRKKNLFHDGKGAHAMSSLMRHYVAGILHCLPHLLPYYAPTVNSYKRLVEGAWAPTTVTWGIDNRTTALRVIPGNAPTQTRLEMRVTGSDVNPYLAMAACLASGLYGIRKKLKLSAEPTSGSGYADTRYGRLPANLGEATALMRETGLAEEFFGKDFADHFAATREWEWRQYAKAVTDWELRRYFEII